MFFELGGKKVFCDRPDADGAKFALDNFYALYYPILKEQTMWALDIGAACGDSSIVIARCLSPQSKVVCFEPGREALPFLLRNTNQNPFCTYDIHTVAAGKEYGQLGFVSSAENGGIMEPEFIALRGKECPEYWVNVVNTLDYLRMFYSPTELAQIRFIKVDCEGYDYIILENLRPLIEQNRPVIIAEKWPDPNVVSKLLNAVVTLNYEYTLTPDGYDIIFTPRL